MTDIASILASYRSGQITEADMVEICREWPEVKEELERTSITNLFLAHQACNEAAGHLSAPEKIAMAITERSK